jgi:hypothetical protein
LGKGDGSIVDLKANEKSTNNLFNKSETLKKKEKNEDESFGISETEFCHINFELDWPLIVRNLAYVLSGVDFLKGNKIREEEEYI